MRTKLVLGLSLVLFLAFTAEMCPGSNLTQDEQYTLIAYDTLLTIGTTYQTSDGILKDLHAKGVITDAQMDVFHLYDNSFRKYYKLAREALLAYKISGYKDKTAYEKAKADLDIAIQNYTINNPSKGVKQ